MKITLLCILSILYISLEPVKTQTERYQTRNGTISFEASVPTFESIQAINKSTTIVLDTKSGNIAALALVKGFKFPIALMQEHFNENYIESDDFPKAVLKGTLQGFNYETLKSASSKTVMLNGSIELHGVKRPVSIPVDLSVNGEEIKLNCTFDLEPADFNIEIPSVVSNKIAEKVNVSVQAVLSRK